MIVDGKRGIAIVAIDDQAAVQSASAGSADALESYWTLDGPPLFADRRLLAPSGAIVFILVSHLLVIVDMYKDVLVFIMV